MSFCKAKRTFFVMYVLLKYLLLLLVGETTITSLQLDSSIYQNVRCESGNTST
jgi:hypothetical protein